MKTNKLELENVVEVTYIPQEDNNNAPKPWLTAMYQYRKRPCLR